MALVVALREVPAGRITAARDRNPPAGGEPAGYHRVSLGRFGRRPEVVGKLVDLCRELYALPQPQRQAALLALAEPTRAALRATDYEWALFGRPEQIAPPQPWRWWVCSGGRGGGKTRAICEDVLEWVHDHPGVRVALVGKDAGSVRRIQITGKSGILARSPPWFRPVWRKTDKMLVWPNDTIAEYHSSEEPGTLRGPEYHAAWLTELFHWSIPRGGRAPIAWAEGIGRGLRLGAEPRGIIDSSPRDTEFCMEFILGRRQPDGSFPTSQAAIDSGEWAIEHEVTDEDGTVRAYRVVVRRWSSERNAENLTPGITAEWRAELKGSPLEEQELDGIIPTRPAGALWTRSARTEADGSVLPGLDDLRVSGVSTALVRIVVAVDPTRANTPRDEAGIMVAALGEDGVVYLLEDATVKGPPELWARRAIEAALKWGAQAIVLEQNRLPTQTRNTIQAVDEDMRRRAETPEARQRRPVQVIEVTASDGKGTRAEPVATLYARGRVRHVVEPGNPRKYDLLEAEMCAFDPRRPGPSPNRMDALVWGVTELVMPTVRRVPISVG